MPVTPTQLNPASKSGSIERDITYCTPEGIPQKLDIYHPITSSDHPTPAVIYIHGGAWLECDKDSELFFPLMKKLQEKGIFTVSINYRLAPEHPFPAMIEDARCAVRYLRENAMKFNIDPKKIGVFGDSAGGHLALLVGMATSVTEWDTPEYAQQSSRVQAVVDIYGITDNTKIFVDDSTDIMQKVFRARSVDDPVLKKASPLTYVAPSAPPMLIVHGDVDQVVPYQQSIWLYDAMKLKGNSVEFLTVKNADHNFIPVKDEPIEPPLDSVFDKIVVFFEQQLK